VRDRPADSPLPSSEPSNEARADLELATVVELPTRLAPLGTEVATG
jgi:hypothetical protein